MNIRVHEALSVIILIFLSGCGRISDWGKQQFYQGNSLPTVCDAAPDYIKEVVVHDQMRTEAKFVCLWASADPVVHQYATLYARRFGCTDQETLVIFEKKRAEWDNQLVFYVLSLYNVPLGDPESEWAVSLCIDGELICPSSIESIELNPEYASFFGQDLTLFKQPYAVTFTSNDLSNASEMTLVFRTITKQAQLCWNFRSPQQECGCDIRRNCTMHSCQEYS
jgi:hypothetical protein